MSINIAGNRYGKLTAIKVVSTGRKRQWECVCDCGEKTIAQTYELRAGKRTQCEKCRSPDIIGKTFNNLTVIGYQGHRARKSGRKVRIWKCQCICGKIITISTAHLGHQKGCGCQRDCQKRTPIGFSAKRTVMSRYRHNARYKKIQFSLTDFEMEELFSGHCYYCGRPPSKILGGEQLNGDFVYNGIDRLRNDEGYVSGNVVSCCSFCNYKKGKTDWKEFIKWVFSVANHLKDKINDGPVHPGTRIG